ncbi:putative alpha/beta-Hydrolase [Vibrio nigripulchritudo SOn1]|uniref:Alpha/beta-Hydrolase n=1 Tax=Vibrio nigripulchritudo SOn1 TaxID=1238450 RepID=A0AAV2VTS5_9VIBR|nr:alpha/beta hydrolase-fold protein [Vibrio nigripulchritudo]CCO47793.1 putative alpha/beta-Hydrolase [Vibrio nigripulchritudo SOn1]
MKKWIIFLATFWASSLHASGLLQWPEIKSHTLTSTVLEEQRRVWVSLPGNYHNNPDAQYPVIYFTDGSYLIKNIQGAMWALNTRADVPEAILIAIENPDNTRARDLTPTVYTNEFSPPGAVTGQSAQFERFIVEELVSWVNTNYRTDGYEVIAGHSLGGLFVVSSLISPAANSVFEGYVAMDPSLWWDNQVMIERVTTAATNIPSNQHMVYISGAWEENIPPEFMDLYISHIGGIDTVSKVIEAQYPLNSTYQIETTESHRSIVYSSLYNGIRAVFQCYPKICVK